MSLNEEQQFKKYYDMFTEFIPTSELKIINEKEYVLIEGDEFKKGIKKVKWLIENYDKKLNESYIEYRKKQADLSHRIDFLDSENRYFNKYVEETGKDKYYTWKAKKIQERKEELERYDELSRKRNEDLNKYGFVSERTISMANKKAEEIREAMKRRRQQK